jgi:hypothetical protein
LATKEWTYLLAEVGGKLALPEWCPYNASDLLANYYLCFYQDHLESLLFPRYQLWLFE